MTKIEVYKSCDLPIVVIDDYFSENSCKNIWRELEYLNDGSNKMRTPDRTGGGYNTVNGEKIYLKNNIGTVLDAVYADKSASNIITETRSIYHAELVSSLIQAHKFFKLITNVNNDSTKVHYFENTNYYKLHHDASMITVIYYLYKEPKAFTGGDIIFENTLTLECKNNRCLIFPSILSHEVDTVNMLSEFQNQGLGRYAISQFMFIEDKHEQ
jgi:Rps23 Pro-64 3,4-dihydroxylase Tpa1-like proline 4-hydroxylase